MGPGQNRHFTLPSHRGGQFLEPRDDAKLQKPRPQNPLVSVLEVLESDESFMIQGWWPDS
jgi:hypothetical protein